MMVSYLYPIYNLIIPHDGIMELFLSPGIFIILIGRHNRLQHASKYSKDTIRSIIVKERELFEGSGFGE